MTGDEAYMVQVRCVDDSWMDVGDVRATLDDAHASLAMAVAEPALRSALTFRIIQLRHLYDRRGH